VGAAETAGVEAALVSSASASAPSVRMARRAFCLSITRRAAIVALAVDSARVGKAGEAVSVTSRPRTRERADSAAAASSSAVLAECPALAERAALE
jgi:hypothetical protein